MLLINSKYTLVQNIFLLMSYLYHLIILFVVFDILKININYITLLHSSLTLFVCFYILYYFNSFANKEKITAFDKKIIYTSGYLLLLTTTFGNLFLNELKNVGYFADRYVKITKSI
tara:strand:- start:868 stop:1215 length:348 start_codon:yes stop_codon:yes gene_type:complete